MLPQDKIVKVEPTAKGEGDNARVILREKSLKRTPKGYIRRKYKEGLKFEHVIVWEKHNGKIPAGFQIHHRDFNKTNNNISNLQLVTPLEHKRLHEGCILSNGDWFKPCKECGEYKKCDNQNWYFSRGWINGRLCKPCYIKKVGKTREALIAKGWKRKKYPSKPREKVLKNIQRQMF
jgi:hypothetical protein